MRYVVNTRFADAPLPPLVGGTAVIVAIADYIQSTGVIRIRVNGLAEIVSGGAGAASLVNSFFVGAALSTGANGVNSNILDVGLLNDAIIGTSTSDLIEAYAADVRGAIIV